MPINSLLNPCNPCGLPTYSRPSFESANPFPPQTPVTSVGCQPTAVLALKVPIPSLLNPCNPSVTSVGCQPTAVLALKVPIPSLLNPCNPCSLCRLPTYSRPSFESANPFPPQTPVTSVGCQPTAVLALKVPQSLPSSTPVTPVTSVGCQPTAVLACQPTAVLAVKAPIPSLLKPL